MESRLIEPLRELGGDPMEHLERAVSLYVTAIRIARARDNAPRRPIAKCPQCQVVDKIIISADQTHFRCDYCGHVGKI